MARTEKIAAHIRSDPFANELGATVEVIEPGFSRVSLTVTEAMLNFHGMTHGGVVFSLGDIAFAAASNSRGQTAVALNVAISFLRATAANTRLVAECRELQQSGPIALYDIVITTAEGGHLVAKSQATVYRKREWFIAPA